MNAFFARSSGLFHARIFACMVALGPTLAATAVQAQYSATITVDPLHLPIGKKANLSVSSSVPAEQMYEWFATCAGSTEPQVSPIVPDGHLQALQVCVGSPGIYDIDCTVRNASSDQAIAPTKAAEWHAPNRTFLLVGKPAVYPDGNLVVTHPNGSPGIDPRARVTQMMWVKLFWNQEVIGSCAEVYCHESVRVRATKKYSQAMRGLNKTITLFPAMPCPVVNPAYGNPYDPDEPTWYFASPILHDRNWLSFDGSAADTAVWNAIQAVDANAPVDERTIATKEHTYIFSGHSCNSVPWKLQKKYKLKLVVELRSAGNISMKIPVWRPATS